MRKSVRTKVVISLVAAGLCGLVYAQSKPPAPPAGGAAQGAPVETAPAPGAGAALPVGVAAAVAAIAAASSRGSSSAASHHATTK